MRTMQTMRIELQEQPRISVHWTELQIDTWLAKWYNQNKQTH